MTTDFENGYQIAVMTSTALKGKAPGHWKSADWARYHRTFKPVTLTPRELAVHVWRGYAFTPVFTEARKEEFFKWSYHLAFDFDSGDETSSLPFLMERPGTFIWTFASFGYSTPSSTDEHPRSRVVFVIDSPILSAADFRMAYQAIAWRIADDGSQTDPACKDPLRLYYGSPGGTVSPNWSVLGMKAIECVVEEYRLAHPAAGAKVSPSIVPVAPDTRRVEGKLAQLGSRVRNAPLGEGHGTLLRMARLGGGYIATGALDEAAVANELLHAALARPDADEDEIRRTIADGIANGKGEPIQFTAARSIMGVLQ